MVGAVHGLAGSAALMLAVLGTITSPWTALGYVLVFGVGTMAGMLALSGMIGMPFAVASYGTRRSIACLQVLVGTGAVAVGLSPAWRLLARG